MEIVQNKIKIIIIAMLITMIIINVATPVFATTGTTVNNNLFDNILSRIVNLIQSIINSIIELFMDTPVIEPPVIEPPVVVPEEINYIFIGDSRTVMMFNDVGNEIKKTGNVVKKYAVEGKGYNYFFKGDMLKEIENSLKKAPKGTKVIIWLGVNDLYQDDNYVSKVNSLANTYTDLKFYYVSVTAVNETKADKNGYSIKNKDIDNFNATIKEGLNSKVKYVDINSTLQETLKNGTTDGIHYNKNTNIKIWETIHNKI